MECKGPKNKQRAEWSDRFEGTVAGSTLTVKRIDKPDGWGQMLQYTCCGGDEPPCGDDKSKDKKEGDAAGDDDGECAPKPFGESAGGAGNGGKLELGVPSITMFTDYDETVYPFKEYNKDLHHTSLINFVGKHRLPLMNDLTVDTMNNILE